MLYTLHLSYEIIFIDDGSSDNTYQLLRNLKLKDDKIIIVKFIRNFGQSAALAAGFNIASGDIAITIDGDLQYDPRDIALFLEKIQQNVDVVCGWRQGRRSSLLIRRAPSLLANFIGVFIFGLKTHDFSCSFRAYKKKFYKKLYLADGLHRFIPILAKFEGLAAMEVKVVCKPRVSGMSKYSFSRFPIVIKDAIFLKITELVFNKSCDHLFRETNFIIDAIIV